MLILHILLVIVVIVIKFISIQMRTQNHHKHQQYPIKSPSPDVRNKNIIRDTIAPLQQISQYQQNRSRRDSPTSSNTLIFHTQSSQLNRLKNQIAFLRQQLRIMRANQIEYQNSKQKNILLSQQLQYLQAQINRIKNDDSFNSTTIEKTMVNENDKILKEFNDRIIQLAQENKRLIRKLQEESSKSTNIYHQNQILKNQILLYQQQIPSGNNQPFISNIYTQAQSIATHFQNQFQKHFQTIILQLQNKLQILTNKQNQIQTKLLNNKIYSTNSHRNTPFINNHQNYDQSINVQPYVQLPYSPIQKVISQQYNKPIKGQMDYLGQEKQKQIHPLDYRLTNNQNQKNNIVYRNELINSQSATHHQSQLAFLKERIKYLEQDLKNKINKINNFQEQNILKEKQCSILKKRLDQSDNILKVQKLNYRAALQQQRIKTQNLLNQKNQLIVKINQLQSIKGSDLQLKLQMTKFQKLAEDTKILQQQFNKRTNMLSNTLKQYIILIQQIKSTLTSPNLQKIISNANQMEQKQINIQTLKIQSNNVIAQLRKKLILKEEIILQLEKSKNMLIVQIQQLNAQIFKLKNLIKEYSAPQAQLEIITNTKQVTKTNIGLSLKQCIQQAMTGINKLQLEVNTKLTQINDVNSNK